MNSFKFRLRWVSLRWVILPTSLLLPLALLGCGGGGGSGPSTPGVTPTATVVSPTTGPTASTTPKPGETPTTTPVATAKPTAKPTSVPTATPVPTPTVPPLSTPIPLTEGIQQGANYFPVPSSTGATIAGDSCDVSHYDYHIHSHLSIFLNGKQIAVPAAIGIKNPHFEKDIKYPDGFATYGDCVYSLHTHDTSGRLHVEAPVKRSFTLGEMFLIWNQPLSRTNIAGITGLPVVCYIRDSSRAIRYDGALSTIELLPNREITFQIGTPITQIPTYDFSDEHSPGTEQEDFHIRKAP